MADAVRNVTIRLSIEPGEVTLPDLSGYRLAREDVAKLNTETKTFTELTKEAAANEKTLGEVARESANAEREKINAHRQVDQSAKQSADAQIANEKRLQETIRSEVAKTTEEIEKSNQRLSTKGVSSNPWVMKSTDVQGVERQQESIGSVTSEQEKINAHRQVDQSAKQSADEQIAQEKRLQDSIRTEATTVSQEQIDKHREVDQSAKQSADEQIAQTNRVSDTIAARMQADMEKYGRVGIQTHKGYVDVEKMEKDIAQAAEVSQQWRQRDIDAEKQHVEEIATIREEVAVESGPKEPQYLPDRSTYNAARRPLTEPGEENIARNQQARIKAEQEASQRAEALREALAKKSAEIEEQLTEDHAEQVDARREATQEGTDAELQAREQLANAQERAERQLPQLMQRIQSGALGSAAATARLGLNIAMLAASGKKDTEELARNFVNIQAKIGLITQSKELFTGMNQTLQGLQQAGRLTQNIVQQQQALGIATSLSQRATLDLAAAAGTAQAAMGPLAIIAMTITAAMTAASMIESQYAETAEEAAQKKEDRLKRYDDMQKQIIKTMENEKLIMEEQNTLLNMKWEITRLLLGDQKMSVADQKVEVEERQKLAKSQTEENFRLGVKEIQNSPERAEKEKQLAIAIQDAKDAVAKSGKRDSKEIALRTIPGVDAYYQSYEDADKKKLKDLEDQQKRLRFTEGDKQLEQLMKTEFVDGKPKDEDKLRETMKSLPIEQQRKMQELIKTIEEGYQQQLAVNASALPRAERDLATAKANLPQLERDLITNGIFGEEENVARRYGTQAGQSARDQAMRQLDQFDAIKGTSKQDLQRKETITKEIEKTLTQDGVGLMTDDIKALLSKGAATDTSSTSGVREKIADASSIDAEEAKAAKENFEKLKRLRDEAKDATANLPALIEEIRTDIQRLKGVTDTQRRRNAADNLF